MIMIVTDGHLTGVFSRLTAVIIRTTAPGMITTVVVLGKDLHLQLGRTLPILGLTAAPVDHEPVAAVATPAVYLAALGGPDAASRLGVRLPEGGGLLLKVGQPFEAVRLGEQVYKELTLPVVEVGEDQGLDDVGHLGQQAPQVLVVVQVENSCKEVFPINQEIEINVSNA